MKTEKRPILYLTANDKLGVLTDERKLSTWKEKLNIVRWWYQDRAIEILKISSVQIDWDTMAKNPLTPSF